MPKKSRISKDDIVKAATEIVRSDGIDGLNARSIAAALGCSTQPIFSHFSNMEEIKAQVISDAYLIYLDYKSKDVLSTDLPQYKAEGMAYIHFAASEHHLFKLLFMRDRHGEPVLDYDPDTVRIIHGLADRFGISFESAKLFHTEMWVLVHGIAVMTNTNFTEFNDPLIERMLSDVFLGTSLKLKEETNVLD